MNSTHNQTVSDLVIYFYDTIFSPYFIFFIFLLVIDIVTGYSKAFIAKKFDSKTGSTGLIRHANVLISIIVMGILSSLFNFKILFIVWCTGYIINYIGSFIENMESMGVNVPKWLKPLADRMKVVNEKKLAEVLNIDVIPTEGVEKNGKQTTINNASVDNVSVNTVYNKVETEDKTDKTQE